MKSTAIVRSTFRPVSTVVNRWPSDESAMKIRQSEIGVVRLYNKNNEDNEDAWEGCYKLEIKASSQDVTPEMVREESKTKNMYKAKYLSFVRSRMKQRCGRTKNFQCGFLEEGQMSQPSCCDWTQNVIFLYVIELALSLPKSFHILDAIRLVRYSATDMYVIHRVLFHLLSAEY